MEIKIKIDEQCKTPKVIVMTDKITPEIHELINKLSQNTPQLLVGMQGEALKMLDPAAIYRVYAANGKVYAEEETEVYQLRLRLYELEERLSKTDFVRISNSEIIHLKKVKGFDLSYTGTICVTFLNGKVTYVSRRYVKKIKEVLGI